MLREMTKSPSIRLWNFACIDKHCAFEYDLYTKTELVKFNMEEFIVKAVQGGLKGKVIEKNLFNFC
ncbi:unnamed protein product [Meloidogyne enterolobii]|uniref:Uncharacterized protein n=1 Tax=Meloidogyne enterolobii TaxID=390850 RepID=A0ACB0ZQ63_MELEN